MFDFESGVVDECVRIDKGITRIYYPYLIGAIEVHATAAKSPQCYCTRISG